MPTPAIRLLPLLVALTAPLAFASESAAPLSIESALKRFQANIGQPASLSVTAEDIARLPQSRGIPVDSDWLAAQSNVVNLGNFITNQDYGSALQQARRHANQSPSPEIRKAWEDLATALAAEQSRAEETTLARIDAVLQTTATAMLEASKASELDPRLDELQALQDAHAHRSSPRVSRAYGRVSNALNVLRQWQEMLLARETGEVETVRRQLREFAGNTSFTRLVPRSQILAYTQSLDLTDASLAAAMARLDPVIEETAKTALAASTAEALDPLLARLDDLKGDYENSYNSPLRRARDRVDNAITFFRQWQDFLGALESGDERDARQQLRNLSTNTLRYRPVPRAVSLKRGNELLKSLGSETDHLLADLEWNTLAEVRERVSEAQEQAYGRRATELARIISELDRLAAARAALDKGRAGVGRAALGAPPTVTGGCGATSNPLADYPASLAALRDSWWFDAMPALTGLDNLSARAGDETAADYARRQFNAAVDSADWPRAHRFALVERDLLPAHATSCGDRARHAGANPVASLDAWIKAQKFERAAQTDAAAAAYRDALAAGAPPALEEILIARLRALAGAPANVTARSGSE